LPRKENNIRLASQPQRRPHEKRIWSTTYVSHVLPVAKQHQPGITSKDPVETVSITADIMVAQDVLGKNAEASSSVSSFSVI